MNSLVSHAALEAAQLAQGRQRLGRHLKPLGGTGLGHTLAALHQQALEIVLRYPLLRVQPQLGT